MVSGGFGGFRWFACLVAKNSSNKLPSASVIKLDGILAYEKIERPSGYWIIPKNVDPQNSRTLGN